MQHTHIWRHGSLGFLAMLPEQGEDMPGFTSIALGNHGSDGGVYMCVWPGGVGGEELYLCSCF